MTLNEAPFNLDMDAGEWLNLIRIELNGTMEKTKAWAILRNEMAWYLSTDPLHYLFLFKVFSQWKPFLQSLFYFYVSCMRPMSLQYANIRHFKKFDQRYTYWVLQTFQMKLILLCVWAEPAVLGSTKTALKFKYEI